jgi:uncharacterized membrane protein YiaA
VALGLLDAAGEVTRMSFGLYLIGVALLVVGLAYAASMMNVPGHWIAVGVIVILGIGLMTGVSRTRMKDPS